MTMHSIYVQQIYKYTFHQSDTSTLDLYKAKLPTRIQDIHIGYTIRMSTVRYIEMECINISYLCVSTFSDSDHLAFFILRKIRKSFHLHDTLSFI